jgi:hypothetical protein
MRQKRFNIGRWTVRDRLNEKNLKISKKYSAIGFPPAQLHLPKIP